MASKLEEIARQAAVSKATVSRVLNEKSGVSPQMRRAVLTAIDVLGFERPRGLRPRSSGLIGLILPTMENPIYPLFAQVVQTNLVRQGYTPVVCIQSHDSASEDEYVGMLLDRGVSGIMFVEGKHADTTSNADAYQSLIEQHLPIVFIDGCVDGIDAPCISCDGQAAGQIAVQHLAMLGHKHIGLLLDSDTSIMAMRLKDGYLQAMHQTFGGEHSQCIDISFAAEEGGYAGALRLYAKGMSAIICSSDLLALGAIHALTQHGKNIPRDVSIVGYGDSTIMGYTQPALTTIRQPMMAMGSYATRVLIDDIRGNTINREESLFPPELVVRASTGIKRG